MKQEEKQPELFFFFCVRYSTKCYKTHLKNCFDVRLSPDAVYSGVCSCKYLMAF